MKRKIFSILFALVLVVSLGLVTAVPAAVSADPGPSIGFWQPNIPTGGKVEFSTATSYSPSYSVYLEALLASSPNDANEVYVASPTGVTTLSSLNSVSFWYYCPSGGDPVPPQIDIWLDTDTTYSLGPPPTGDDEWLLGQFPVVTTFNTWVNVPLSAITWIRAMDGKIYGTGSAGLTAAKGDHGTNRVLAIGIEVGSHATRATTRSGDQKFYVDDLTINGVTYDLGPTSSVGMTADVPDIVAISAAPTSIDFGYLLPGQTSAEFNITVQNIGTHKVDVDGDVSGVGGDLFFDNLQLKNFTHAGSYSLRDWPTIVDNLVMGASEVLRTRLPVPLTYTPTGTETATLIFTAVAQ